MSAAHDLVQGVLGRYLSSINSQNVLARALREARLVGATISSDDVRRLLPSLEKSLRLFLPVSKVSDVVADLQRAFVPAEPPSAQRLAVRTENDISEARIAARALAEQLGARRVVVQKVATVVSELARNMFMYAGGGQIDLVPGGAGRPRLTILATDAGPGIPNVDEIMAGRYRSRTGLGAGLLGTKRLVDRFELQTGPTGTHIELEVNL
jgi:serine/threonine-protein kinase RsbT